MNGFGGKDRRKIIYHNLMVKHFFYALLSAGVVTAAAIGADYGAAHWLPEGRAHELAERWITAPGQSLCAKLNGNPRISRLNKNLQEKIKDSALAQDVFKAKNEAARLMSLYNIGTWTGVGFILCLLLTILLGVSSIKSALVLGLKVTLFFVFLQAALVLGASRLFVH